MSLGFRTYRENVDDPQNSMMQEMFQLLREARQQQTGSTSPTDLERKRVTIVPTESYLIFISDGCFVIGKQRYLDIAWKWFLAREPDGNKCKCILEFDHRQNVIPDRSLRGNRALLQGYPTIIAYQPEYPRSSLSFNGSTTAVTVTNNAVINNLTDFSISFWIRITAPNASNTPYIISKNYAANNSFILYLSTNSYVVNFRTVNNTGTGVSITSSYPTQNNMVHGVATYKAST